MQFAQSDKNSKSECPQSLKDANFRKRKPIDSDTKTNLILSVVKDHLPIYQAAIIHKVKYSSAKHILRNYYSDTANYFSLQKKRRRKIICCGVSALIEISSGNIVLATSQCQMTPYIKNGVNAQIKQKVIDNLSVSIHKQICNFNFKRLNKNFRIDPIKQMNKIEKIENKVNFLMQTLEKQHIEMTQ
ncbi:unnamed protein product (macronuclear) [Paramecium tetraurelia]|uniref:HTH psq-type domain-containing protein n=1 Tax=Paramecium tetraurelia TaxID=5888 RepID=A0BIR7_PARTE|nr:uncharacterized protein GSPATT00004806001 [Paramecium tetraurelia]CAK58434.1 unnamed protein product [Paramecium tetraurelia]|eukprot:XP_001425832.1 hypothetical protein (macronuclear) [Paramecium tetraurelia strain d4-2]